MAYVLDFLADVEDLLESPSDGYKAALLGLAFGEVEEFEEARDAFKQSDVPGAKVELAKALVRLEAFDEADELIEALPDNADREYLAGLYEEALGNVERAISCFEGAVEMDSNHVESAFKLGVLLDRIGDDDMAIEKCSSALTENQLTCLA